MATSSGRRKELGYSERSIIFASNVGTSLSFRDFSSAGLSRQMEETMKKMILGAAIISVLGAGASLAADKKMRSSDDAANAASSSSADANAGRGGLAEWPVSKEEADWSSAAAPASGSSSGASTGGSSGTSGSSAGTSGPSNQEMPGQSR